MDWRSRRNLPADLNACTIPCRSIIATSRDSHQALDRCENRMHDVKRRSKRATVQNDQTWHGATE